MSVTLVIPMLNEAADLPALLQALAAQTRLPEQVIFVDAGSVDEGPRIILDWWGEYGWPGGNCRVECNRGGFPGANRNVGARLARSEWIAFLDCGIFPAPDWLAQLLAHARRTGAAAVFGLCEFVPDGHVARAACALGYGVGSRRPVLPASLFRCKVFATVGPFREDLRAGEDIEWMARLEKVNDARVVCEHALVEYRHFPASLAVVASKNYLYQRHVSQAGLGQRMALLYVAGAGSGLALTAACSGALPWLLGLYVLVRGFGDPLRRSSKLAWWGRQPLALVLAPLVALVIDVAKLAAILRAGLHRVTRRGA